MVIISHITSWSTLVIPGRPMHLNKYAVIKIRIDVGGNRNQPPEPITWFLLTFRRMASIHQVNINDIKDYVENPPK